MGVPASLRMEIVCVPLDSEDPPVRGPVIQVAMANAVCPASVPTTPPATRQMGPATAWLVGQAQTAPSHALQDTGEPTVPNSANVIMVEPATPRMGAVSAPQAGLDTSAWKAVP